MKAVKIKKLPALILGISYIVSSLLLAAVAYADTRPYFKAYGADTFTGGWFNSGSTCNNTDANYQRPGTSDLTGGVMAFAKYDAAGNKSSGAGSEFGASALGSVQGDAAKTYGFSTASSGYKNLTFANEQEWGGFLEGTNPQTHCVPDYFGTKQNSPQAVTNNNDVDVSSLASGQHKASPGGGITTVHANGKIGADKKITLFVEGDVFISKDSSNEGITYDARSSYTADNAPKFALVVKGNIYVAPDVTQLDGLYIAQPDSTPASSGVIWTCHTNNANVPTDVFVSAACRTKLTVNGAFIAKQVNLLRIQPNSANGGIDSAVANEPPSSANIAEVFNFTPEMVVGGGFFNPTTSTNKIESLINLPPVF